MKHLLFLIITLHGFLFFAQQNSVLINSFFKDRLLDNSDSNQYRGNGFLPVFESEYDLNKVIRDSSKQFYTLTNILFKKHLFELKGENYFLTISPVADLTLGKDRTDTTGRRLFQNTRGIFIEGDLLKSFSFSTAVYENQARFSSYETAYYSSIGELYPNQSAGTYSMQNAVIPGAARTKPFKIDGFDYAYAVGNIIYRPHRSIILSAGNNAHFIGDGYRSLLLSDNSVPAPFVRAVVKLSKKWEFNYLRIRLFNLIRRPVSSSVESYYESKSFSANYISYRPNNKFSISLFEGVIWSRGDSITSKRVHPLYYSPIPGTALAMLSKAEMNYLLGINFNYTPLLGHRIYGQVAATNCELSKLGFQIGYRRYSLFGQKNLQLQVEYNHVPKGMYQTGNMRMNYSYYNLPMAAVKGSGFEEIVVRLNHEWNRCYIDEKLVYYSLNKHIPNSLLPITTNNSSISGNIALNQIELGYRFNRKMNLTVYGNWQVRSEKTSDDKLNNLLFVGFRTGILNHYNDF